MKPDGGNLLVLQGGGPTAVINASLYGVLAEAAGHSSIRRCIGARFGIEGLLRGDLLDLSTLSRAQVDSLRTSPGAALGSTRYKPSDADLEQIVARLREYDIRYLLLIGGNGSLRGGEAISRAAHRLGYDVCVVGVPKTVDNDIPVTDRCPGFGSAARYVAQSVRDLGMDVRGLPQPASIYETMGRGVGWLAAASVLAKMDENHAPHLVYLPERAFDVAAFLAGMDRAVTRHGWAIAVVSEGLRTADGRPVYETPEASQRDALNRALPGGVGTYLAGVVTRELKIRCRWEKPGLCGRASMLHVSTQDLADAELVGRAGVRAAVEGCNARMVSLRPLDAADDPRGYDLIPLSAVAGAERCVPAEWIDNSDTAVAAPFALYLHRIVGDLVEYAVPLRDLPIAAPKPR
jgi:6-phosphofructokinase 1